MRTVKELKKELARVHARESEAVMQSERDARRADANAAALNRLTESISEKLKTCRNDALEEAAKRLEWAMPRAIHKDTMTGACIIIRALKEK